ncbi:hypothetical protein ACTFVE_13300, partial [Enterococcus faecium]
DQSINQSKITKNLSQNEVHSDPDLILYNPSVLIDKEPKKEWISPLQKSLTFGGHYKLTTPFCLQINWISTNCIF